MDQIEKYILDNISPQDELLAELERETFRRAVNPRMISGHLQGKLLEMFIAMIKPKRVLEIGTFTGYATLSMAAALGDDAIIDTIEADDELPEISASFFERSPHGNKIRQHIGSALEVVPALGGNYDFIFIDGGKREYPDYYRMLMGDGAFSSNGALVHSGSYMLADNVLWYGKVLNPSEKDADTLAVVEFNRMTQEDSRVENVILPLRDGLNLIRVR